MRRRVLFWLLRSSFVAVGGCNAIVGTQDVSYVEPPMTPPASSSAPPPTTTGQADGGTSISRAPDAGAAVDADSGVDGGIEEGSDASASGDF